MEVIRTSKKGRRKSRKARERLRKKKEKQKKIFFGVVAGIIAVLIIVGIVLLNMNKGGGGPDYGGVEYEQANVGQNSDTVEISSAELQDGDFHYYEYNSGGTNIKYFMVKGSDGQIHTAFDACDVCFEAKKGYAQDGNNARCRNCGNKYSINELGTKNAAGGGCWPGYLPRTVSGGNVVIKTSDLRGGSYYFK
jgi:uncharacterized membrane protein